jgi:hypothetical protein
MRSVKLIRSPFDGTTRADPVSEDVGLACASYRTLPPAENDIEFRNDA